MAQFVNINLWDHNKSTPVRAQADTNITPLLISRHQAENIGFKVEAYLGEEPVTVNGKSVKPIGQITASWNPKSEGDDLSDDFYVVEDLPSGVLIGKKRWEEVKNHLEASAEQSKSKEATPPVVIPPGPWIWSVDEHKFFKIDKSSGKARLIWKEN